jgi:hypothetical protein
VTVSVLGMVALAGPASGEPAEPKNTHDRVAIEEHLEQTAAKTDSRDNAQALPQQLQTDRAMEQSSKALNETFEELRKQKEKQLFGNSRNK